MDINDDFYGKELNLNYFYMHTNFEQKYPKTAIVPSYVRSLQPPQYSRPAPSCKPQWDRMNFVLFVVLKEINKMVFFSEFKRSNGKCKHKFIFYMDNFEF